eukprot:Tbor_TRINITY_DN5431_c1_g3::TRINITY_DN5431_c1_g3_i1::g.24773::m.24773
MLDSHPTVENCGQKYKIQTAADFRRFRDFCLEEDNWANHYEMQGPYLRVQSRVDNDTKLTIFRVQREMPTTDPAVLYDQFHDADYRKTWDNNMLEGYNICKLNPHNDIGYYALKLPWPLKNRDFCNMRSWMEFTNGDYAIFNHSVPHSQCPPSSSYVRGKSYLSGYLVSPLPIKGGCRLIYITHADMCGSIPKKLIDMALNQTVPKIMSGIENCAAKYVDWSRKEYPKGHVHSWVTPKMDWDDCTRHFPVAGAKQAEKEALCLSKDQHLLPSINDIPQNLISASEDPSENERVRALEDEIAALKKKVMLGERGFTVSSGGGISLAPVSATQPGDPPSVQRYRAIMNDILSGIDRQFIQEGRVPTLREYMLRIHYALQGIQETTPAF